MHWRKPNHSLVKEALKSIDTNEQTLVLLHHWTHSKENNFLDGIDLSGKWGKFWCILCPYCHKSIFWNKIWKRERKNCVCCPNTGHLSSPIVPPGCSIVWAPSPVCGKQQHFLSPTSIVSTLFAEFSRKMRSQWVSGGQGLTRCQGSSWKSHQAARGKSGENGKRRNGRGKIRLGREIKMFSPFLGHHWKLYITLQVNCDIAKLAHCFYFSKRPIVKSSWDIVSFRPRS